MLVRFVHRVPSRFDNLEEEGTDTFVNSQIFQLFVRQHFTKDGVTAQTNFIIESCARHGDDGISNVMVGTKEPIDILRLNDEDH